MFEKEAEEYLKTDGTKAETIFNILNEISPLKLTAKQVPFILAMLQQVYKDGAEFGYNKANEWHDLRKDPNYLPNNARFVLVALKLDTIDPKLGYCTTVGQIQDNKKFNCEGPRDKAIAWRELPTFED